MLSKIFQGVSKLLSYGDSEKVIIIDRFCYGPEGTFGKLTYKNFSAFTVERPWRDNIPYVSCIPDGIYTATWHDSPKFGKTLAVHGGRVSIYPNKNKERNLILFHVGNWPENFSGCIGLGKSFSCVGGKMGVSTSRITVENFLSMFEGIDNIPLIIKPDMGTYDK